MAKLQVTIVTTIWLAMFEYELVDKSGLPVNRLPIVNSNIYGAEKPKEIVYLRYKRKAENNLHSVQLSESDARDSRE
jgi:hypothetical protein